MTTRTLSVAVFGPQAEAVGAGSVEVTVPADDPLTAGMVREAIGTQFPGLGRSIGASRLACDHAFVGEDEPIDPAGELALIGLVGGG